MSTEDLGQNSVIDGVRPEYFLQEIHLGHFDKVARELSKLPRRCIHEVVRLLAQIENEMPLSDAMSLSVQMSLPLSRLVSLMIAEYSETTANALLEAAYTFRSSAPQRAVLHLSQLETAFVARGDILNLANTYLWRALVDNDRRDYGACVSDTWRCIVCAQQVLRTEVEGSAAWRKAVRCLAGAQHQFGIVCRMSEDFEHALLYYHRALSLAPRVDDWRRVWATEGSIANVFADQSQLDRAVLYDLRSLIACLRGLHSPEMSPLALSSVYENVGLRYALAGEWASSLTLFKRSHELSIARRNLLQYMCSSLHNLNRLPEVESCLAELLREPRPVGDSTRLSSYLFEIRLCRELGKADLAGELTTELIEWILRDRVLLSIDDAKVQEAIRSRMDSSPVSHGERAMLSYAIGRREAAEREIRVTLAEADEQDRGKWAKVAEEIGQQIGAASEKSDAEAADQPGAECRACGQPVLAARLTSGSLCELCAQALSLEDTVAIPGGDSIMPDESKVRVESFHIDRTPVTNRLFRLYTKATRQTWEPAGWKHALRKLDNQPVGCVSRLDCVEFCKWRSRLNGKDYRLPTAAEWLRAALGDDGRVYPWGDEKPDHTRAAFVLTEDEFGVPPTVGLFPAGASPFGVLDMAGTVFEWTASTTEEGQPVHLGGAYSCEDKYLNVRYMVSMDLTPAAADSRDFPDLGFRCVSSDRKPVPNPEDSAAGLTNLSS